MNKTDKIPQATEQEIEELRAIFLERYPNSQTELKHRNLYELLVSVILSAQCTDKRVNQITPALYAKYPTVDDLANAKFEDVRYLIQSCSYFNNKAKNLIKMAQKVVQDYNSQIPLERDELKKLAGVGQKTANVVMAEYTNANVMAVDTHVFRVAHRLGLSDAKTPIKTEEDLTRKFKTDLRPLHKAMVLFGRYRCKALNPLCKGCFMLQYCKSKDRFKA